jgi:hypothetical protein
MPLSFCDKVKQFFRDLTVKDSCISSCCNTVVEKEHKHHHHHHKHKHKDIQKEELKIENKIL